MDEMTFFLHILLIAGATYGALKIGKGALTALIAVQAILANLFVLKQMTLFGWDVTCADVFAIGSIAALNLLQEFFGKEEAKRAIWVCFYSMLFVVVMSQIQLLYVPNVHDFAHPAFSQLLGFTPRLLLASLATFFIVQQVDLYVYGFLKRRVSYLARSGFSLLTSQLLDTVLFSMLGLYGIVHSIFDIVVVSYLVKVIAIGSMTPLLSLMRRRHVA